MDISYLLLLQNLREITHHMFDSFFSFITLFGEDLLLMLFISAIYWCVSEQLGKRLLLFFHFSNIINQLIKNTACVYRPWIRSNAVLPVESAKAAAGGYSFPSGHTAKACAVFGGLAYTAPLEKRLRNLAVIMALAVGFSRNWLGVHTPQDVLVSLLLAGPLLYFANLIFLRTEQASSLKPNRISADIFFFVTGCALFVMFMLAYITFKSYPADYFDGQLLVNPATMIPGAYRGAGGLIGFAAGWLIDLRFLHFHANCGDWQKKLWRYLTGAFGLCVIMKIFPTILALYIANPYLRAFAGGLSVPLYIMVAVPACFRSCRRPSCSASALPHTKISQKNG